MRRNLILYSIVVAVMVAAAASPSLAKDIFVAQIPAIEDSAVPAPSPTPDPTAEPDPFAGIPAPEQQLADEACLAEIRQCCCCPNWTHYAIFDVLFLQRNNQIGNAPLVYNADTRLPVMTGQDLYPSTGTGIRLFYGSLFTENLGWEIGYTGIYGMFGDAVVSGPANLELPPPLGLAVNNFNDADSVRGTYASTLNIFEANMFCYDCCQDCGPNWCGLTRCKPNCHCIDWLGGFIWAGLNEQASMSALCCSNPPQAANYTVRTATNYFGAQIGMRGRREWQRWAVEGWWKTALCGTNAFQSSDPIVGSISGQERGALSASDTGVGFIGMINATAIYKLTQHWGLRLGYNFYWLTNAALAPSQWDFQTAQGAGTGINDNGGLFLQGVNLGTEYRW